MVEQKVQIIAPVSRKGGVGKSSTAVTLAAGLAIMGKNVLLVDTDSQGHASLMLAMPDENGLYQALIEKRPLTSVIRPVGKAQYAAIPPEPEDLTEIGHLWLLPSSDLTFKIPLEIKAHETFLVLEMLEQAAEAYDLDMVVIDTSPSLTAFDGALWMAVDWFLFVTECERLSVDGIQSAYDQMKVFGKQREKYLGRPGQMLGILPNKLKANTLLHRTVIGQLGEAYQGDVWTPVMDRIAWAEAAYLQKTIFQHAPNSQASRDAWAVVNKTLEVLNAG